MKSEKEILKNLQDVEQSLMLLARELYDKNSNNSAIGEIDDARQHIKRACISIIKEEKCPNCGKERGNLSVTNICNKCGEKF